MIITIRDDASLQIFEGESVPRTTEPVTGEVLDAVEVIRAWAKAWQDPEVVARELALLLALEVADDEQTQVLQAGVPFWEAGQSVDKGTPRLYGGEVYIAVQAHTTQVDWAPPNTPALWRVHRRTTEGAEVSQWVQPTGTHDAYKKGDEVMHKGRKWRSKIDANTTVPDGDEPHNRYWEEI